MQHILTRTKPSDFKTLGIQVEACSHALRYQTCGLPLNFAEMLALRQPIATPQSESFSLKLANLGVSVRLTLNWQGHDYWIVVRQQRHDRHDTVLKLISGYVPAHELGLPLITALQEVAEECLIEEDGQWLSGRYADTWLPTPYPLLYHKKLYFTLNSLERTNKPISYGDLVLHEQPEAYIHLPSASLQLVYDFRLALPAECRSPSLYHVDERLEEGELITRLDRRQPDLYLARLAHTNVPTGELFSLQQGQLQPLSEPAAWLSEGFAHAKGWFVAEERVAWQQWNPHTIEA